MRVALALLCGRACWVLARRRSKAHGMYNTRYLGVHIGPNGGSAGCAWSLWYRKSVGIVSSEGDAPLLWPGDTVLVSKLSVSKNGPNGRHFTTTMPQARDLYIRNKRLADPPGKPILQATLGNLLSTDPATNMIAVRGSSQSWLHMPCRWNDDSQLQGPVCCLGCVDKQLYTVVSARLSSFPAALW